MTKLELAKELGVTKNKLNYHLKKLGITLEKINGVYQISDADIESVKESILESVKIGENRSESALENDLTENYIESLKQQIEYLQQEVAEKNEQLKKQDADYKALAERMSLVLYNENQLKLADKIENLPVVNDAENGASDTNREQDVSLNSKNLKKHKFSIGKIFKKH